jgi:2-keto-4-pentenoate hydratase/2-oxohepta-3-ene-1,7-dioic acid hydratase in catechol pathway
MLGSGLTGCELSMKLVSFQKGSERGVGIATPGGIVDLRSRLPVASLRELLAAGLLAEAARFESAPADFALESVTLLPVIPEPAHFYCIGVNYAEHLNEVSDPAAAPYKAQHPSMFIRYPESITGAGSALLIPRVSEQLDFEAELAVIIGKGGRYIDRAAALSHVAGYTCCNEGSVRDWQVHTSQVSPGKNFFSSGSLGPWMVTADAVGDPGQLAIACRVNGQVMQNNTTARMIFDVPSIIAYASSMVPLMPGDVISTGTPQGVGYARKPPVFLKAGDICEVEIERIGVLRNPVAREVTA